MTAEERLAMREKEINECHTCQRHKELEAEVAKLRKALVDILAVDDWLLTARIAAIWEIAEKALA